MTSPAEPGPLGLNPERLLARSQYFARYAEMVGTDAWPEPPSPADLLRRFPLDPEASDLIPLDEFPLEHGNGERAPFESESVRVREAADAYRQAAIAVFPVRPDEARAYLLAAARQYRQLGMPFGLFLQAICGAGPEPALTAVPLLAAVIAGDNPGEDALARLALTEPVQHLYLLRAVAGSPEGRAEAAGLLDRLGDAPQARDWSSAGPAGLPVGEWWRFGLQLASASRSAEIHAGVRFSLIEHLRRVSVIHGSALRTLRRDTFHWRTAHFRADLVDVVVAGVTCLLWRTRAPWLPFARDFLGTSLDPMDMMSLTAGFQLAELTEPPGSWSVVY
ncbi:hypothetical protein [Micromonospora coerulea]|uniref:hypothetical protein n=1 Tax=Micromonospora coerulea TaxID=47856 RepID=UPI0019052667|nr:hypothetical protein [Micromonospora veneta]